MDLIMSRLYRLVYFFVFLLFLVYEIFWANIRVAYAVLMPRSKIQPALVSFPLTCRKNIQITFFANIISLTPGTLALEISEDKTTLLLHTMFLKDEALLINQLRKKFESRIMVIWP